MLLLFTSLIVLKQLYDVFYIFKNDKVIFLMLQIYIYKYCTHRLKFLDLPLDVNKKI